MTYIDSMLMFSPEGPVVLLGGSGVVGRALAPLLMGSEGVDVVIAARAATRAAAVIDAVARENPSDRCITYRPWTRGSALEGVASAVVGLINDPDDSVLDGVVGAGVPFVDVTRWTSRLALTLGRLAVRPPRAPVVLASGWMGGLLPRVVRALVSDRTDVLAVDGAIRYGLADAAGGDSVDYIDRLWIPFEVRDGTGTRVIEPFVDRRVVVIDGVATRVHRFDTPEQFTLPFALPAVSRVAVRLGFDDNRMGWALGALVRLGLFRALRSDRCTGLRRALLRSPGVEHRPAARTAFRVDVQFADGTSTSRTIVSMGQARLTAVGALLALRQVRATPAGMVRLPEMEDGALLWRALHDVGVDVLDEGAAV